MGQKAKSVEAGSDVRLSLSELQSPAPYRLIRNIDTTFSQQILDVAIAERKPEIQLKFGFVPISMPRSGNLLPA